MSGETERTHRLAAPSANCPSRRAFRDLASDDSAAAPGCGTEVMRGGGRPFGGPPLSGFEGLFVAGIGGSHPLGTLERREERREEEELDRVSGRSPVRARRGLPSRFVC